MTNEPVTIYERLSASAVARGLRCRGGFAIGPGDVDVLPEWEGRPARSLVLLGFTGAEHWSVFSSSPEFADGEPDPLDRWSARVIGELAGEFRARPLYPFSGPPWWPFQRWAQRAEALHATPLGILMHPQFGPWHAYRGALLFAAELPLPAREPWPSPCARCATTPCIAGCPAGAVTAGGFDRRACAAHVESPQGVACRSGCLARAACPVGASYRYRAQQATFHMQQLSSPRR